LGSIRKEVAETQQQQEQLLAEINSHMTSIDLKIILINPG